MRDPSQSSCATVAAFDEAKQVECNAHGLHPLDTAHAASLHCVSDAVAGISRRKRSSGYAFRDARGRRITDGTETARIRAIGIPPAWTSVWISPRANGHIQATGRDTRGRKRYRYHVRWQALQSEHKFGRLLDFGAAIPAVRARVNADLALADHSHAKVLAIVVRLLETTYIRWRSPCWYRAVATGSAPTVAPFQR